MGNTKNTEGKRIFDDVYSFPQDSQDLADDIYEIGNARVGSSAERQSFPPGRVKVGMLWSETDTGALYKRSASGWERIWEDTGWQPLGGLATGWSVQGGDLAGYRVLSGVLYLRGRLDATAAATQLNILNTPLPVNARPYQDTPLMIGTTGGSGGSFVTLVQPSGQISCYKGSNTVNNLPLNAFGGIPVG